MTNDSTTGGPLLPDPTYPAPLVGQALNEFLQGWMVGITGMDPTLIRPRWQTDPDNIPVAGQYWVAFGVTSKPNDAYAIVQHDPLADGGLGADLISRHMSLEVLTSFYDLGVNGQADNFASLFKDGIQVAQNRELLDLHGFQVVEASNPISVPVLFKQRWQYRVDLALTMRQQVVRQYPVRSLVTATGTLVVDTSATRLFVPLTSANHR